MRKVYNQMLAACSLSDQRGLRLVFNPLCGPHRVSAPHDPSLVASTRADLDLTPTLASQWAAFMAVVLGLVWPPLYT